MQNDTVSDSETKKVIGDFLELGYVENIVAMFRHNSSYYEWVGELLVDERFNVRIGLMILFEELQETEPENTKKAVSSLLPILKNPEPLYRGEAISLLGIIADHESVAAISATLNDPSPQVREMAQMILDEMK